MSSIEQILNDPAYHDYLGILKGARNGFVYGVKVRFPHALIMAILFGRGECVHTSVFSYVCIDQLTFLRYCQLENSAENHLSCDESPRAQSRQVRDFVQDAFASPEEGEWRQGA